MKKKKVFILVLTLQCFSPQYRLQAELQGNENIIAGRLSGDDDDDDAAALPPSTLFKLAGTPGGGAAAAAALERLTSSQS